MLMVAVFFRISQWFFVIEPIKSQSQFTIDMINGNKQEGGEIGEKGRYYQGKWRKGVIYKVKALLIDARTRNAILDTVNNCTHRPK